MALQCDTCGKPFSRYKSQVKRRNFCSFACTGVWVSHNLSGQQSPTWRGGHVCYRGPNWPKQRKAALERDGHRCVRCGTDRTLQVNHKVPFRCFDSYLDANRIDNLETLCVKCHRRFDGYLKLTKVAPPPAIKRTVVCVQCGAHFWSQSGTAKRCEVCSPRRNRLSVRLLSNG
jgi:hypothetical protein